MPNAMPTFDAMNLIEEEKTVAKKKPQRIHRACDQSLKPNTLTLRRNGEKCVKIFEFIIRSPDDDFIGIINEYLCC